MRFAPRSTITALLATAGLAAGALSASAAAPAHQPGPSDPVPVADGLVSPLSLAVTGRGDVYVTQNFAGLLTRVERDGTRTDLVSAAPAAAEGVSVDHGTLTWTQRTDENFAATSSVLFRQAGDGTTSQVDLLAFETAANPDAVNAYGIQGLDETCAGTVPAELAPFLLPYQGRLDTHAYGTTTLNGTTYVADAGANAVLAVSADGVVSTVAVLPPTAITLTADMAAGFGLDPCVAGHEFWAEPVPTDVEVGPHGTLLVTTLPGGAEDDSLGANGALYRVRPATGDVELVARGFVGATGLAVAPTGTVYVTELFAGRVSAVSRGVISPVADLPSPAAIEWARGQLYVTTDVFGNGSVVTLRPRG
jgi:glucose/arabinose dehydrogenase